jgi:hypothetical protein
MTEELSVYVFWEFDIETDADTQRCLKITSELLQEALEDKEKGIHLNDRLCEFYDVPNRFTYLEDESEDSYDLITNHLSDTYGWLVKDLLIL